MSRITPKKRRFGPQTPHHLPVEPAPDFPAEEPKEEPIREPDERQREEEESSHESDEDEREHGIARGREDSSRDDEDVRDSEEETPEVAESEAPPRRPRKSLDLSPWRRYWPVAAVAGPLLFVMILPWLIAHSPIMTWMIDRSAADLHGTLTARSASLGWFSPVVLYGVEVRDKEKRPVMEIARLTGDRALLSLLFDSSSMGKFKLDGPKLNLVLRDEGSNLEDVLAAYLDPERPASNVDFEIEAADGSMAIEDARSKLAWQVEKLHLNINVPTDRGKPIEVKTSGALPDKVRNGGFEAALQVHRDVAAARKVGKADDAVVVDEMSLKTEHAPLAMFESVLRRFSPGLQLSGRFTSSLSFRWDHGPEHRRVLVGGTVTGEDLRLAMPALGADKPALALVKAGGQVMWQDGWLKCDRVTLESDVGTLGISGVIDWRETAGGGGLRALLRQNLELNGKIDLARLAAALPQTMRVKQGTKITSGQVQWSFASRRTEGSKEGTTWQGRFETSNLSATRAGRKFDWQQPILIQLAAHEGLQGPVIENLQCESSFFRLSASGTRDLLTATATFDLNRLADQSSGFIDLGGIQLAGSGTGQLSWERLNDQHFEAQGELRVQNFRLAVPNRAVWSENALVATLAATGRADLKSNNRMESAAVQVRAGTGTEADQLTLRLAKPVAGIDGSPAWPIDVTSTGQLARWQPRLAMWFNVANLKLGGTYDLRSQLTCAGETIALKETKLTAADLLVQTASLDLREPKTELTLAGRYDRAGRRLDLERADFTTSALGARATNFLCATPAPGATRMSGTLEYSANLDRLQQWFTPPGTARPWQLAGRLAGRTDIQQVGTIISAQFTNVVNDFTAANPAGEKFHEREIRLAGRGVYNDLSRSFQIEQADLTSGTVGVTTSGSLSRPAGQTELDLSGRMTYDFERLTQLLRSRFGDGIRVAGRGSSPVSFRGPLGSDRAVASGSFAWTWADIYGLQAGPGELQGTFTRGALEFKPLSLAVNEGRVELSPRVNLSASPVEFVVQPGRVAEQVRITPAMCASALQYVAPVLAGVAAAEGRISIELDVCRIPIDNPSKGDLRGRMTVHALQVGPGYLTQELAQLLARSSQIQIQRESVVPFGMVDGWIYHNNMELVFPDVTIKTSGWVGLDQRISLIAELPVPAKWQADPVLGPALKGQSLKVPIGGTLRQPRLDRKALDQLAQQAVQAGAKNAVQNVLQGQAGEVGKQLERLVNPQAQPKSPATQPRPPRAAAKPK